MVCSILLHIVPLPQSPCPGLLQGRVSRRYRPQDIVAKSNFTLVLTPTSPLTLLTFPTNMEFCRNKIRTWSTTTNSLSLEILQFHVSHFLHPLQSTTSWYPLSTQSISRMIAVNCLSPAYYDHRDAKAGVTRRQTRLAVDMVKAGLTKIIDSYPW